MTAQNIATQILQAALLCNTDQLTEAGEVCRRILAVDPDNGRAMAILGVVRGKQGNRGEGIDFLKKAVQLQPDYTAALANLGKMCLEEGRLAEAVRYARKALAHNPNQAGCYTTIGIALLKRNRQVKAEECFRRAIELDPSPVYHHINLCQALRAQRKHSEATQVCRAAIERDNYSPELHYFLATTLHDAGDVSGAGKSLRAALRLRPDYANALISLGNIQLLQGLVSQAIACYRQALAIEDGGRAAISNLLFSLNYAADITEEQLFAEHLQWDRLSPVTTEPHSASSSPSYRPDQALNIGYVSADFRCHPVGMFLLPVVAAHDRRGFRIFCYSNTPKDDDYTRWFREHADAWRDITAMADDKVAATIRNDGIDILIDLAGHTSGNRLPVFARKPSPMQMTWAGYVGSTGLAAMDYLISDRYESPPGAERFCTERIIRLPDGYVCYGPPTYAPPVAPLPAAGNGYITFGCFNNLAKVNPDVVALWGRLLSLLPDARILLKTPALAMDEVRERYLDLFRQGGVDPERVELQKGCLHRELLEAYRRVDIALDPFPYSGGLTTIEALWMGVPVVTLGGNRFCARHSVSHLSNAGLPDLVATGPEEYLRIATALAGDLDRLATLRSGMRDRLAAAPLCDGVRFTRNLESAFREAWRDYCARTRQTERDQVISR